jgi:PAS domain S-box-containing protein
VESSDDAIMSKTLDGVITSWNQGAEALFGYSATEMIGRSMMTLVPDTLREEERGILERLGRGERLEHFETSRLCKDGRRLDVSLTISPIRDSARRITGASTIARDISARKRTEAELTAHRERLEELVAERTAELERSQAALRMTERLAALGTLSAGLGHDMANLLMPVRAHLDALDAGGTEHERASDVAAIRQCTEQLRHLSTGLRMLAVDPNVGTGGAVDLATWWPDVLPLLRNILPAGVCIKARFEAGLPRLGLAPHQLTQAVFNLVQNSADALQERGTGTVTIEAVQQGDMIRLSVSDDGPGMTEQTRRRCLEPFFTTKTRGISTGLGLALVQGVVKQAGGTLDLVSESGQGTRVILGLPRSIATGGPPSRRRAVVRLRDERIRGYVASVLMGMRYDAGQEAQDGEASLWVSDSDLVDAALEFVRGNNGRRAILIGPMPSVPLGQQVVAVGDSTRALRRALEGLSHVPREAGDEGRSAEGSVRG